MDAASEAAEVLQEPLEDDDDVLQPSVKVVNRASEEIFFSFFVPGTCGSIIRAKVADSLGVPVSELVLVDRSRALLMQQGVFVEGDCTLCVAAVPRGG